MIPVPQREGNAGGLRPAYLVLDMQPDDNDPRRGVCPTPIRGGAIPLDIRSVEAALKRWTTDRCEMTADRRGGGLPLLQEQLPHQPISQPRWHEGLMGLLLPTTGGGTVTVTFEFTCFPFNPPGIQEFSPSAPRGAFRHNVSRWW